MVTARALLWLRSREERLISPRAYTRFLCNCARARDSANVDLDPQLIKLCLGAIVVRDRKVMRSNTASSLDFPPGSCSRGIAMHLRIISRGKLIQLLAIVQPWLCRYSALILLFGQLFVQIVDFACASWCIRAADLHDLPD